MATNGKQRIAVLGGGVSALSAVYGITRQPNWKDKYEITVYQLGWRLGGKGATGRDPKYGNRILEHGLHLWFGFYENAFEMMRDCYKELGRKPGEPLATFDEAFEPHNQFAMEQHFQGKWQAWNLPLPSNPSKPGDGTAFPPPWDYLIEAIQILYDIWHGYHPVVGGTLAALPALGAAFDAGAIKGVHALLSSAKKLAEAAQHRPAGIKSLTGGDHHPILVALIKAALAAARAFLGDKIHTDLEAYRTWISLDFVGTAVAGILADDLLERGFSAANSENFRDWAKRHGLSQETMDSCLMQSAYDSSFALFHFARNPDMEAGTVLRGGFRMFLMYKGSVVYRFAAGTGDSVFAPVYQVLAKRGVRFEFFNEVQELVAPASGPAEVQEIKLVRQAHVKGGGEYQPLVDVKGLPCWPKEPRYEQLVEGDELRAKGVNLESHWADWKGEAYSLKKGVDFDLVISGLSFEPLRYTTPTLQARSEPLRQMLKHIQVTRTQAFQLWTRVPLEQLGWKTGSALLSTFVEPMDTWADLTPTIKYEDWQGLDPKCVGYFCGAMTDSDWHLPPRTDHGYPDREQALVKQDALSYIRKKLHWLWPDAYQNGQFKWDLLVDPENRPGESRFDSQFWRANIDPSELYVLSVTGSSKYRLRGDRTGFDNLYLVGDYTACGLDAGCMEACVISALQVCRAITGSPHRIVGEGDGLV